MNQKELLILGEKTLKENHIEESYFKAKKLLAFVLKQDSLGLTVHSLEEVTLAKQREYAFYLEEMAQGKPLQYITNSQEFMGLDFFVDERVLIPQPDTEILVEETIKVIEEEKTKQDSFCLLDLCTGSGAIGIYLAKYLENHKISYQVYGSDISQEALEVAKKNANTHTAKINFIQSDMFEQLKGMQFDVIVSNPPYIETETIDQLPEEVKREPKLALDGGEDGLAFYRKIAREARDYLKQDGYLFMEIGYNQKEAVMALFQKEYQVTCQKDLAQKDRVIKAKKKMR